jgi:hypothetical protein
MNNALRLRGVAISEMELIGAARLFMPRLCDGLMCRRLPRLLVGDDDLG